MLVDIEKCVCKECIYVGEYDDAKDTEKKYMLSMIGRYRKNKLYIKRNKIYYDITIILTGNRKKINVEANQECTISSMYSIVMEILRFENLFEGLFYSLKSFSADGMECVEEIKDIQLAYYESAKRYTYFHMNFSDNTYKRFFTQWLKTEKKMKIIHPVFLMSTYLEGMPVDMRMALLLETFEPLAEELGCRGDIILVKPPYKTYTNKCKKCGAIVSRSVPNKELTFADKIRPLIRKYGKEIFSADNKSKLIKKAVKVRNKVDHVRKDTKNAMNGKQCGVYIYKFSLMYRYIILMEIGLMPFELTPTIKEWVEKFNNRYAYLII